MTDVSILRTDTFNYLGIDLDDKFSREKQSYVPQVSINLFNRAYTKLECKYSIYQIAMNIEIQTSLANRSKQYYAETIRSINCNFVLIVHIIC